jgi:hypothetical protein
VKQGNAEGLGLDRGFRGWGGLFGIAMKKVREEGTQLGLAVGSRFVLTATHVMHAKSVWSGKTFFGTIYRD